MQKVGPVGEEAEAMEPVVLIDEQGAKKIFRLETGMQVDIHGINGQKLFVSSYMMTLVCCLKVRMRLAQEHSELQK